ncbi:hypothetical protein HPB50_025482 [Hyalomma asiaticum]|uniref:Uncharacterized protein n=1 Tax=Hyalomma asiaticum TaxID=266040 RepID=A0ACB7SKY3_HYAAI|nr:hypothetical protein HPB50_025482 [Hyalomma asiaticum]
MATGTVTSKNISKQFPSNAPTALVIGDSQCKYLHQHFDMERKGTPAFLVHPGATIDDAEKLLDLVPRSVETVVLHVGTNDISRKRASVVFRLYRLLLGAVTRKLPQATRLYASLILPRAANRHQGCRNRRFVERCNQEACKFNSMLRRHCRRTRGLFYLDHGLEWLPPRRMLAADGLHPSFEGVGIMASHLHELLLLNAARARRDSRAPTASAPPISRPGGHPPTQDELNSTAEFPPLPPLTSPASNPATTTPSQPRRAATPGTGLASPSPPVGSNSPEQPKRRTYNLRRPTAATRLDSCN